MLGLEELVALAKEVEINDPIDWSLLSVDRDSAYRLLGISVLEYISQIDPKLQQTTLLAIVLKLTVENFVLNLKLLAK